MSEDRTNGEDRQDLPEGKDPLFGGLDGISTGQTWEGAPKDPEPSEDGQSGEKSDSDPENPARERPAYETDEVQSAEEEARRIANELHREAVRTGNIEKETEVEHAEPKPEEKKKSGKDKDKEKSGGIGREIFEWVKIVVSAAIIAFVLNTFIIANSEVPSGSMENTIMTGDRVIGCRLSYRFEDPKRGDIAIFRFPDNEKIYYVKRIIGLPGETVDIIDGKVYINGSDEPLDEPYIREPMIPEDPMHFEVPEGCYFMLGDNRNYSMDARRWENTYVKREKIIAKVLFRYFPNPGMLK